MAARRCRRWHRNAAYRCIGWQRDGLPRAEALAFFRPWNRKSHINRCRASPWKPVHSRNPCHARACSLMFEGYSRFPRCTRERIPSVLRSLPPISRRHSPTRFPPCSIPPYAHGRTGLLDYDIPPCVHGNREFPLSLRYSRRPRHAPGGVRTDRPGSMHVRRSLPPPQTRSPAAASAPCSRRAVC